MWISGLWKWNFAYWGSYSTQGTYCQYAPYVLRVRSRRTKTFSVFLWWFVRMFVSLQSYYKMIMTEQEIFSKKANDGYAVCFAEQCPRKEYCLRYLVGLQMPYTKSTYHCVNLRYQNVATEQCPLFRNSEKVKFAKGMKNIFNADMPRRVEPFVRQRLIGKHCRTYYFEYRRGARLMPPAVQEEVRSLFREAGWNEEVHFDGYVEDYDW